MSLKANKRFWKNVVVEATTDGFVVALDGRQIKTPAGLLVALPTRAAAELVAAEWAPSDAPIDPEQMPATRWANSSLDKVSVAMEAVADMLAEYGGSDLLCYRAEAPVPLIERQATLWDQPLKWAETTLNAPLQVTSGIIPVDQPNHSLQNLRNELGRFDAFELAAIHDLVVISGSLILALAVIHGEISADHAWECARVDENWQIEQWGEDEEAATSAAAKRESLLNAAKFFESLA